MKTMYLIRGVSGSGKTTFAKTLEKSLEDAKSFAADDYFYWLGNGEYQFAPNMLPTAHGFCRKNVTTAAENGVRNIIVHNTFTTEGELLPYLNIAADNDYKVVSIVMENRHGNSSVHAVPLEVVNKQAERLQRNIKLYQ